MREDRLLELSDVASEQWGMFTSAQAKALGVTAQQVARLANSEVVERLRHGVYRLGGVPEDPRTPLRAAWLALEPARVAGERYNDLEPGVVSHRSAAWAHGLGDLEADDLEFSVPVRRQSRRRDTRFHLRNLDPEDWELIDGLPVTTVGATVRDLAQAGIDGGHLAGVVRDALVDTHTDLHALAKALRPYAHQYGSRLGDGEAFVEDLLEQAGVPTSTLETAAAVSSRRVREANQLLASPAVVENLRYLQSPALQQNLARLNDLSGQNAMAALLNQAQQQLLAVHAQQAMPAAMLTDVVRQLSGIAGTEAIRAMTAPAAAAARHAVSASLTDAVARLAQLSTSPSIPMTTPAAEAAHRAITAPIAEAAARLAQLHAAPSRTVHSRHESSDADAPSTPGGDTASG